MSKNRIKVEEGDKVIYVTRPTKDENAKAQLASNKMFKSALLAGALVRKTLGEELERQGIWNDEKQKKLDGYNQEIVDSLVKLKKGGIKLSEARDLAIKVRIARMNSISLQSERNEYDAYTAEAQAENEKIDYLVSLCLKKEDGEPYFEDVEDYREHSEDPLVVKAAGKLITMIYGVDDGWEMELPENQFLAKYKFINDDLRLVNKDGDYVTVDGKKINENFQYVDDDGNVVDEDGNRIDDDGLPIVETLPFLDDDGNPIIDEEETKDTQDAVETIDETV